MIRILALATTKFLEALAPSDIQRQSVDRTAGYFGALNEEVEQDVPGPVRCAAAASIVGEPFLCCEDSGHAGPHRNGYLGAKWIGPEASHEAMMDLASHKEVAVHRNCWSCGGGSWDGFDHTLCNVDFEDDEPPTYPPPPKTSDAPIPLRASDEPALSPPTDGAGTQTPDTSDLDTDPETQLALAHCELAAAYRRLARYREAYVKATGNYLAI